MSTLRKWQSFGTIAVAAATTSAHTEFTTAKSIAAEDMLVYNSGATAAFIATHATLAVGVVPTAETQNSTPVGPGVTMLLKKGAGNTSIGAITASGSGTVYVTAGKGQ